MKTPSCSVMALTLPDLVPCYEVEIETDHETVVEFIDFLRDDGGPYFEVFSTQVGEHTVAHLQAPASTWAQLYFRFKNEPLIRDLDTDLRHRFGVTWDMAKEYAWHRR